MGNKAFSSTGKVAPGAACVRGTPMEGECKCPHNATTLSHALGQGGAAFFKIKQKCE